MISRAWHSLSNKNTAAKLTAEIAATARRVARELAAWWTRAPYSTNAEPIRADTLSCSENLPRNQLRRFFDGDLEP
jgi:hypothetical protein